MAQDNLTPPEGMRAACRRGLALAPEFGGAGLTAGARARARAMAAGEALTPEAVSRCNKFFLRHARNRADPSAKAPTPGAVAWLLWGGDAGRDWSAAQAKKLAAQKSAAGQRLLRTYLGRRPG